MTSRSIVMSNSVTLNAFELLNGDVLGRQLFCVSTPSLGATAAACDPLQIARLPVASINGAIRCHGRLRDAPASTLVTLNMTPHHGVSGLLPY